MDELLVIIAQLLLHWRAGLSLLLGVVLAVVLAAVVTSFTGGYGIGLIIVAFGAGLIWETNSASQK